jgi:hypothetical protein
METQPENHTTKQPDAEQLQNEAKAAKIMVRVKHFWHNEALYELVR